MAGSGSAPDTRMCSVPERAKLHIAMSIFQLGYAGNHVILRAALNMGISKLVFPAYRNLIAFLLLVPFAYFLEMYVVEGKAKTDHFCSDAVLLPWIYWVWIIPHPLLLLLLKMLCLLSPLSWLPYSGKSMPLLVQNPRSEIGLFSTTFSN